MYAPLEIIISKNHFDANVFKTLVEMRFSKIFVIMRGFSIISRLVIQYSIWRILLSEMWSL